MANSTAILLLGRSGEHSNCEVAQRFFLDAAVVFASVSEGHGVARIRREADDSYRGRSRWDRFVNPPRGGFFYIARKHPSQATSQLRFRHAGEANARWTMHREPSYRGLRKLADALCFGVQSRRASESSLARTRRSPCPSTSSHECI